MDNPTCEGKFILASASPRRRDLLSLLGIPFAVVPAAIVEDDLHQETPEALVRRLALEKAAEVARGEPDAWVLGADTVVDIDGTVLGKPADRDEARVMLRQLSGRTHTVHTGFAIIHRQRKVEVARSVASSVTFRTLSEEEIAWYTADSEPYDKAGAYALQGRGAMFIRTITGSHTNVMGLPLSEVAETLSELRALVFALA